MANITVAEALQAFSPAFKSIDLRIVAVKLEEKWANVITSMFLSSKSQKEIKSEQQQVRKNLPETDKFRILLCCHSFDSISGLFKQIEKGELEINGNLIKFHQFDPMKLKIYMYLPSYLKEKKEWKLIGSHSDAPIFDEKRRIMDDQNGSSRLVGYENVYELIRETLRIKDFDRGLPKALVIGIPMPARITDISLDGELVKIKVKKVFALNNLQLNISVERVNPRTDNRETIWRPTKFVNKCKHPLKRGFCYVTNSVKLANLKPHDRIEVELIHRKVPTLRMDRTFLEVPLENAVEPFAKTLGDFCSLDLFRKRLLSPEKFKKSDKVFENAVAWLLSLAGFSVATLGRKFEKLRVPETKYELGSIDMIAYRENERLLLVDCDTSIPDERKIRSMMTVKEHFRYIQDEHKRPIIVSVIFSPKDCSRISVGQVDVIIMGKYQIEQIFKEAMMGNAEKARSIF